jgi:hypothetical protein
MARGPGSKPVASHTPRGCLPRADLPGDVRCIHMRDDTELITPAEAFRLVLRARYPERPALADEIVSSDWFLDRQRRPPFEGTAEARDCVAAFEALNAFYKHVVHHEIRLRGVSQSDNHPRDVDPIEQAVGDLNIWEGTLDCRQRGVGNFFQNIWAHKTDVMRIIRGPSSASRSPKKASFETYSKFQRDKRAATGNWSSREQDKPGLKCITMPVAIFAMYCVRSLRAPCNPTSRKNLARMGHANANRRSRIRRCRRL